ncbi:MAG TPA: PAC2 family protein [Nitrosopumilaceae archaeon]|nr:PAC2 family protein [Nitrosopumilaceae archaeon]
MTGPPEIRIKEIIPINIEEGFLVDGFPSIGFTSAIATESLIHTSQFKLGGVIDSDSFPPVSIIKDGVPNFPTRIFVNEDLKVAVFSSYLTLHESLHRIMAKQMLDWAKQHKCSLVVSSVAVKTDADGKQVAAGSTNSAKAKLKEAGFSVLQHGTIPGIPGALLNEGMLSNQDVAVILFNAKDTGPDFKASVELCMAMAKLVPGVSCNIESLQKDAETAEREIKETDQEAKHLADSMYR